MKHQNQREGPIPGVELSQAVQPVGLGASPVSGPLMDEGEQAKGTENRSLAAGLATPAVWMEELE